MRFDRTTRKPRSRRGQRGAVLVEAAVIMPLFIMLLAGAIYLARLYTAKLEVMGRARRDAWREASGACTGGASDSVSFAASDGHPPGQAATMSDEVRAEFNAAQSHASSDLTSQGSGSVRARASEDVTADGSLGGATRRVAYQAVVTCNEPRLDGDVDSIIEYFWGGKRDEMKSRAEEGKQN